MTQTRDLLGETRSNPPKIVDTIEPEGESEAFIPYADLGEDFENVPIYVRPEAHYYRARMGFFPNALKLYLHTPWIADSLFRINNAIMRDERNSLDEHFKYKLALSASRTNGCNYCTAHHAKTLARRWGYEDSEIESVLSETDPADEREKVALEFVNVASADPKGVPDALRQKMASLFTPPEVMEIVLTFGFWKMYNAMHDAMALPIEDPVLGLDAWTQVPAPEQNRSRLPVTATVEIYTLQNCGYCTRAKSLLAAKGAAYIERSIDEDETVIATMLSRSNGRTSAPQIFINDALIGGFDDLLALEKAGELDALLAEPT